MAEALIKISDIEGGEVEMEVKFSPEIDNNSAAHQLVSEFVKFANMDKVEKE